MEKGHAGPAPRSNIENLNKRLNVIDFAGLFSGNAIGPTEELFRTLPNHVLGHQISVERTADRVSSRKIRSRERGVCSESFRAMP